MLTLSQQIRAMLASGAPRADIVSHCRKLWPDVNPTWLRKRIVEIVYWDKKKAKKV